MPVDAVRIVPVRTLVVLGLLFLAVAPHVWMINKQVDDVICHRRRTAFIFFADEPKFLEHKRAAAAAGPRAERISEMPAALLKSVDSD